MERTTAPTVGLFIGYTRQLRRDLPLTMPLAPRRRSSNLHGAGHQVGAAQGGRHQGPPESEGPQEGLAVPGSFTGGRMVGEQGGMASAQSCWGRLAALLLRVLYALFPQVDWNFVFVDDFLWLLRSEGAVNLAVALLATLLALGTPLSWKKTHLAEVNTWLGFMVHPNIPQVLMAANKHILVMEVLQTMVEGQAMHSKDIEKALGRIQWATAARWRSRCFSHFGPGRWPPWGNPPRWSGCWRSCCVPLQHALRPVLPLLAEVLLVGLQRC